MDKFSKSNLNKKRMNKLDLVRIKLQVDKTLFSEHHIDSPQSALELLKEDIYDLDREVLMLLNLNIKNQVINATCLTMGTINSTIFNPKEIFKSALLSNASQIILLHNHPSGNIEPSTADLEVTHRIARLGNALDLKLLDHIIVGKDKVCYSIREKYPDYFFGSLHDLSKKDFESEIEKINNNIEMNFDLER